MKKFFKNFIVMSIFLPLLVPIGVRSHDEEVHKICFNAKDYAGCIKSNSSFTYMQKAAATVALGSMKCLERRNLITKFEGDKAMADALGALNIPKEILKVSKVQKVAEKISFLFQVDCRTMVDTDQIKMQKILTDELMN